MTTLDPGEREELKHLRAAAETILEHFAVVVGKPVIVGGTSADWLSFQAGRVMGEVERLRGIMSRCPRCCQAHADGDQS